MIEQSDEPEPDDLVLRSPREVAERSLALLAAIDHAHRRPEQAQFYRPLPAQFCAHLSEAEAAFLATPVPSEHDRVQFSWRAEALVSLLWALGHIPSLYPLNHQADLGSVAVIQAALASPDHFVASAVLRTPQVLQEAEDDLYQHHWRVRDAQLFGKAMPSDLDAEVVCERRYGLSWVVGWGDSWDDVPTDT
jgi:hypothetical protein